MADSRTLHNFIALFGAQAVAMAAGLVTTAWLARALQPEAFGIVGFGSALLSYFAIFILFGTDRNGKRDIARDPASIRTVLPRILGLRMALLLAGAAAFLLVVEALDQPDRVKTVMRLQTLGLVATAAGLDFVFQGLQRMRMIGFRQAASSVLVLVAALLLVRAPGDLYIAAVVPHAALLLTALWMAWRIGRETGGLAVGVDPPAWWAVMRRAAPMAVTAATATVYLTADILMLGFLDTAHAVGLYVGAARIYAIAGIVSGLLVAVFLPSLSALFGNAEGMRREYRGFASTMLFLGLPIVATAGCFAGPVIRILLGDGFLGAQAALAVLMAAAGVGILNQIGCAALLSWNGEKRQMYAQGAGAALNVLLNLLLIPAFGIVGAAAASVASELLVAALVVSACAVRYGVTPLRPLFGLGACAAAAFGSVLTLDALGGGLLTFASPLATLAAGGGLACVVYAGLAWTAGLADPRRIRAALMREASRDVSRGAPRPE
ncbi:MAG: oligosaccharide flippase family protein [Rhodospirillaceae bacterium]